MSNLPADPGRRLFDRSSAVHICERNYLLIHPLQSYLAEYSTLPKIRECKLFSRCNGRLCPACSSRVARQGIRDYTAKAAHFKRALALTLSVENSTELSEGFEDLSAVRRVWLTSIRKRVAGISSIEVTAPPTGWHPHLHVILFDAGAAEPLIAEWLAAARELGIGARRSGQDATTAYTSQEAISYALKGKMGSGQHSLRDLLAQAAGGDADAADRWAELEAFYSDNPRRRWRASWGLSPSTPASRTTASTFDYDRSPTLRRLVVLDMLGVRSKAQQAAVLTTTGHEGRPATIARVRRHPAYRRWRSSGLIDN